MNIDFSKLEGLKSENVRIPNWIYPLRITYGLLKLSFGKFLVWKVNGTDKVFRVELKLVTAKHSSNYTDHFILTLTEMRKDIIEWINQGLPEEYMKYYYKQYKDMIIF